MEIHESGEDYLETVLMLQQRMGTVRSIDIASELGYSKPTVSIAMRRLRENGYIENDDRKDIRLTKRGQEVAERMYERHLLLTELFSALGVDGKTAMHVACKIEHVISEDTFDRIREFYRQYKFIRNGGAVMAQEALQNLLNRRSIRKYAPEQIPSDKLEAVLEAGTYAPTAKNLQSPLIVVTQKPEDVAELSRLNAAVMGSESDPFFGAPTVVTVFADSGNPNGVQDASLVMGNLLNAAHAVGLGSCWINRAREVFESPEGLALKRKWGLADKWTGVGHCILGLPAEAPSAKPRREGYNVRIE